MVLAVYAIRAAWNVFYSALWYIWYFCKPKSTGHIKRIIAIGPQELSGICMSTLKYDILDDRIWYTAVIVFQNKARNYLLLPNKIFQFRILTSYRKLIWLLTYYFNYKKGFFWLVLARLILVLLLFLLWLTIMLLLIASWGVTIQSDLINAIAVK